MDKLVQKFLLDAVFLLLFVIVFVWLQKKAGRDTAKEFWTSEREENAKRLFGEAWRDAL